MKLIPLTKGYHAMVDDEDYDRVIKYKWVFKKACYAARSILGGSNQEMLHNFLVKPPIGFVVDHIDRNGLNCQRSNMRIVTVSQNALNRNKPNKHGFRGIRRQNNGRWMAQIGLGTFATKEEAALAYDKAAKLLHNEYAQLNFPENERQVNENAIEDTHRIFISDSIRTN